MTQSISSDQIISGFPRNQSPGDDRFYICVPEVDP